VDLMQKPDATFVPHPAEYSLGLACCSASLRPREIPKNEMKGFFSSLLYTYLMVHTIAVEALASSNGILVHSAFTGNATEIGRGCR
jgi:hypothetical protein